MSEGNGTGVIRIGRKGKRYFAFGDGAPFEIDVVVVHNQWMDVDRSFRDEKGEVPEGKLTELNHACWSFVKEVSGVADLTLAEALDFLARVTEESGRLADFFVPKLPEGPSSPARTDVTFST